MLSRPLSSLSDLLSFEYLDVFCPFRRQPSAHWKLSLLIAMQLPLSVLRNVISVGVSREPPRDWSKALRILC
jgi:hypothetical protein